MFSLKTKRALWKRENGKCFYCSEALGWDEKTIDHVIPKSKGGPHRSWNLVIACHDCNWKKGNTDPTPAQLEMVLQRKMLHDIRVSIGQAIQLCKNQANKAQATKLVKLQQQISEMILLGSLPTDFMAVLNNR